MVSYILSIVVSSRPLGFGYDLKLTSWGFGVHDVKEGIWISLVSEFKWALIDILILVKGKMAYPSE